MERRIAIVQIGSIGSVYFIGVGVLYLWGYWSPLKINILEFVAISDIIRTSAYPVIITSFTGAISYALGVMIGRWRAKREKAGRAKSLKVGAAGRTISWMLPSLLLAWMAYAAVLAYLRDPHAWIQMGFAVGVLCLYLDFDRFDSIKQLVPGREARAIIIVVITALPFWAYGTGRVEANKVIESKSYHYVPADIFKEKPRILEDSGQEKLKYLGHLNQYFFFLTMDNESVLVARFDDINVLQLRHHK